MFFPGDQEFTWERYSSLPYPYVINAFAAGSRLYQERMHDMERPTALVASILSNQNRDPKKGKAVTFEDMSFYKPRDHYSRADGAYGSAMLKMVERGTLPSWALFCFKGVTAAADLEYVPKTCALVAEDAILLHPVEKNGTWEGMLIAQESASMQRREFVSDDGRRVSLAVPRVGTKVICEEGVTLFS